MDKLYAIKIRQSDGTYGAAIPVSVLAENVDWNSTLSLVDILGQVDTSESIQDQINNLKNTRATQASVNALDQKVDNAVEYITHNSEIADARQGADGTEYSTLKERLDSEYNDLFEDIGFLRSDIDADVDELKEKVGWIVTPQMFGAKGDGQTNDTNAIQDALDYAKTNNASVVFPDGVYITDGNTIDDFIGIIGKRATLKASSTCTSVLTIDVPWLGDDRSKHGDNAFIEINIDGSSTANIGINAVQANAYTFRNTSIRYCKLYGIKTSSVSAELFLYNIYIRGTGAGSTGIEVGEDSRLYNICMMNCYTGLHILRGSVIIDNFTAWMFTDIDGSIGIKVDATSGAITISNFMIDTYTYAIKKGNASSLNITNMIHHISEEFYLSEYTQPTIFFDDTSDSYKYSRISGVFGEGVTYNRSRLTNKEIFYATISDFYLNRCDNPSAINRYPITFSAATTNNSFYEWDVTNKKLTVHLEAIFPNLTSGLSFDIPKLARSRYGIISIGTTLYDHNNTALLYLGNASRAAINLKNGAAITGTCSITGDVTVSGF